MSRKLAHKAQTVNDPYNMISIDMYMNYPKFIASNQIEESIRRGIQKATLIYMYMRSYSIELEN